MDIPAGFKTKVIGCFGDVGEAWLKRLPTLVEYFIKEWDLTLIGPVDNLSYNYVLKVMDEKGAQNKKSCIDRMEVPIRSIHKFNSRSLYLSCLFTY